MGNAVWRPKFGPLNCSLLLNWLLDLFSQGIELRNKTYNGFELNKEMHLYLSTSIFMSASLPITVSFVLKICHFVLKTVPAVTSNSNSRLQDFYLPSSFFYLYFFSSML